MNTWDSLSRQVKDKSTGAVKSTDTRPVRDVYAQGMMAPQYSALTFPVAAGAHCIYEGELYAAKQAIAASEAWTAAHWDKVQLGAEVAKVGADVADLKSQMGDLADLDTTDKSSLVAAINEAAQSGGGGDAIIDDTAGFGDTTKVWSADKDYKEFEDVDSNFANIITLLEGYDILHATITEDKFANYSSKTVQSFSGTNLAEFDVTTIVKFKYNYTVSPPDSRGMYFVDKNGTALSTAYQTLATVQDITVPNGAVKCFATIKNIEDIVVYDIVAAKGVEILKEQSTYTDKTSGGITYTWSSDHSKCTIAGTRTGTNFDKMAGAINSLPTGMVAGEKYKFVFNPVNQNIGLQLLIYVNDTQTSQKIIRATQTWVVPATTTGIEVRLYVGGSGTVVNETVDCPEIYTVPDVKSFDERITDLEDAAYGNNTNPLAYIHKDAGLISIFHTVGCIGDSLASGAAAHNEGGSTQYVDMPEFSWGQCLARLTGNTYYNFSKGGASSRSWLSTEAGSGFGPNNIHTFDGDHDCDCYFIGLGQNDKNNSIPVGTTADIDLSDYTQNADTYCGNIGQIIQRLQILQPKAPIFVFIDPAPPMGDNAYNDAIPGIVALFTNVWIIDLKTYARQMFTEASYIIGSQLRSGHYSALGYQEIAYVIATYVDWIIQHNMSAFSQVEFIGTTYSWTT